MKTLLERVLTTLSVVALALLTLVSCKDDEQYDFVFKLPGSIVAEPGTTVKMQLTASNISSFSVSSYPKGWDVSDVDISTWTLTIKAPEKYASEDSTIEENGTLKLTGYTTAGTTVTATCYLSMLNQSIDLTSQPANCYAVWQKDTRYTIDVTHIAESNQTFSAANVDLLWQSSKELVQYYSFDEQAGTFTFFVGHEEVTDEDGDVVGTRMPDGSAIVAAYDAQGEIIWSWHLWLTGSDVESSAIQTTAGVFMDRNLGAYANSDGSTDHTTIHESYGYYYQWGRKDPFSRPYHYNMANNSDKSGYDGNGNIIRFQIVGYDKNGIEVGSADYARKNPINFILGYKDNSYDWIYDGHDADLWSAAEKSVNDPCPKGWRVPTSEQFAQFDIDSADDALPSAQVKDKFGWFLTDANATKMFMLGAGRRSYERGVLTNMNNYDGATPVPWIGYYWTADAGVEDAHASQSMFFDLNTTRAVNNRYEPAKEMYRANGMQVRCVRIE